MQYKAFEPGIEVAGASLMAIVDGFRKYPTVAMKYLSRYGLVSNAPGKQAEIDPKAWYSLENWLAAYEEIAKEIGVNSLYSIGKGIPDAIPFPPHINDIQSCFGSIDAMYHMNHRKNGRVMFNPETGEMLEGIGHYKFQPVPNEKRIVFVAEVPYPCEFDRGLLTAMAARFEPMSSTTHDNDAPCRKKGADSCTYIIRW
jgi:hypothetical protein